MHPFADTGALGAFVQVILIDLVLAGDNAVVIGLAAAGLSARLRAKAILIGIGAATVLRIGFALIATQILGITGLLLAGGLLLLWVCWKMWQELCQQRGAASRHEARDHGSGYELKIGRGESQPSVKTLRQAVTQIIIADVSMSLDNVLAVAGAAQDHVPALIFGLVLSVALMGFASAFIARLLERHRWIAYIGIAVILMVALRMIYQGSGEVLGVAMPAVGLG